MTTFGFQIPNFTVRPGDDRDIFGHAVELADTAEDSGFESVWVMDHFCQLPALGGPDEPMLEAYTLLGALAARDRARAARDARHRRHLPQPRAAREDGDDARRDLAGARDPRHRRGVVRRRARRLRLRLPAGDASASTGSRKRCRSAARCSATRRRRFDGTLLPHRRRPQRAAADAARRPADHDRWQRREAHAAARRAVRRHVQRHRRRGDDPRTSSTCCAAHCDDVGRDPSEITTTRLGTLCSPTRRRRPQQVNEFLARPAGADAAAVQRRRGAGDRRPGRRARRRGPRHA